MIAQKSDESFHPCAVNIGYCPWCLLKDWECDYRSVLISCN